MIQQFVDRFLKPEQQAQLRQCFEAAHPEDYAAIVKAVILAVADEDGPDPERIHEIDDGEYQGTLLYVIAAKGYQPDTYWYVKVDYGSCSGCDTLEGIRGYEHDKPTDEQVADYMKLALDIVEGIKKMD